MNGVQRRGGGKWKTLRERLGFKGIGCCGGGGGAIWGFGASSNMRVREEEEEEDEEDDHHHYHDQEQANLHEDEMLGDVVGQIPVENNNTEQDCVGQVPAVASGVNLAMALAAERHFRAAQDWDNGGVGVVGTTGSSEATIMNSSNIGTPMRVSLMRLLEDGDVDGEEEEDEGRRQVEEEKQRRTEGGGGGGETTEEGNDVVCCVCMRRKKGAAFIPCGHTFCRVCSRELWLNRGSCPLCNRSILEILDIF